MPEAVLHPTAVIDPTAELAPDVEVRAYAVIRENTVIGPSSVIGEGSVIGPNTHLGKGTVVFAHASVGSDPQDLSYHEEETFLVMGDHNRVREYVTINRGTRKGDGYTRIGSHNLFMACSHVAHDCRIADFTVLANNTLLAGHVTVQERAIINGAAGVQQFATIGRLSYVGGLTRIVHDVPPFMVVEGNPSKVRKVNTVGLRRNGFDADRIAALREAHRRLFRSRRPQKAILDEIESGPELTPDVAELCSFLRRVERGRQGRSREG